MIRDTPSDAQQQQADERHQMEEQARPAGAAHRALVFLLRALIEHDRDKGREARHHIGQLDAEMGVDPELAAVVDQKPLIEQPVPAIPAAPAGKTQPENAGTQTADSAATLRTSRRFNKAK